jgi:hypothetical protein
MDLLRTNPFGSVASFVLEDLMRVVRFAPIVALFACSILSLPALASVRVEDSISVDAEKEAVWSALKQYQKDEKGFAKKRINVQPNSVTFKEHFASLPFVGNTTLDYTEVTKTQENRIDYKLNESKLLNKFEGSWIVEDGKDGKGTTVRLITDIDTWLAAPFKNKVLRNITKKGMEKRLAYVKTHAEHAGNRQVSSTGTSKID